MNHRDTDYLYISTRLKARSQNLFSREKLNRLIAARTGEDAVKLLTENGWAALCSGRPFRLRGGNRAAAAGILRAALPLRP